MNLQQAAKMASPEFTSFHICFKTNKQTQVQKLMLATLWPDKKPSPNEPEAKMTKNSKGTLALGFETIWIGGSIRGFSSEELVLAARRPEPIVD